MKKFGASVLVAVALAVAVVAESASAEVITPQVVEPSVVTPHAVAPTAAAPTTTSPAPAPATTLEPATSSELPAAPQPPSSQPSSNTNGGGQVAGGRGAVSGSTSSGGYDRGQAESVANLALAVYNVGLFWTSSPVVNTPREWLSAESNWTLAIQTVNAVHDAIENGDDPKLPTWSFLPREKDAVDVDPPYDKRLDWNSPVTPDPTPTPSGDAGTPASDPGAGDTADPADGGAAGKRVDDDVPKSEE